MLVGRVVLVLAALIALTACANADTWAVLTRDGAGREVAPYLSSLGGGERGTGAVRSDVFVLDEDMVSFEMCGADGWPGQRKLRNWFALCDADTGLALRRTPPPGTDLMTPVAWDVLELVGRRVYFRAVDGLEESAFAWIGWANVRVGNRAIMGPLTPGQLPQGWHEERKPENLTVEEWLNCPGAGDEYALEEIPSTRTWGIMTTNGENRACPPYLSSLRGGEQGTGAVRSPAFELTTPEYTFVVMGADSPSGDLGLNSFQLVDAETGKILRRAQPIVGNTMRPVTWDVREFAGKRVFFRAVDNNPAGGWAWIGCDQVPIGDRVVTFDQPDALVGWREEGLSDGEFRATDDRTPTLAEMLEREWRQQDAALGLRWDLWRQNPAAAPLLVRRVVRAMQADFDRARRLMADFAAVGLPESESARLEERFGQLRRRIEGLQQSPGDVDGWLTARRDQQAALRELAFANPALDFERLLFVKRFTQQSYADINVNHHAWGSRPGGDIVLLEGFRPGEKWCETPLLAGRLGPGNVHGIDLDFDAGHIVFAYSRAQSNEPPPGWTVRQNTYDFHRTLDLLHLYEMRADGSDLRQITDGQWSDLNPCYLPDGAIAFESERCHFSLQCNEYDKDEPTTNLYSIRRDGTGLRRLSVTKDGDWYPRVLADGSLVYSHWEYHERGLMFPHPLWLIRPDGTGADNFAKQHLNYPLTLTVPRQIPDSDLVMAIAAGHHTLAAGPVVLVDRRKGMNDPACITRISGPDVWPELGGAAPPPDVEGWRIPPGQGWYMDPYPLSGATYLASYCAGSMQDENGYALYLMDVYGGRELLYRDPSISCVMPIPLRPRERPPIVASALAPEVTDAVCVLTDVTDGVTELAKGAVRYLRIAEPVPWPYDNEIGGQRYEPDAKATGVNWTPVRIFGTVPVEADGSAYFRVPADTELYFQALDENGMELRRMRSYVSFQPGETRGCAGCHETRAAAPRLPSNVPLAVLRDPSTPVPPPWGHKPLNFLRDIQPVINRNCLSCHSGPKPAGNVDLSPGLTAHNNRAYDTLIGMGMLCLSSKSDDARITPVGEFGSHKSRLVAILRTTHAERCRLSHDDWQRLYTWIDANGVYHDDFIRKRPAGAAGYSLAEDQELWARIAEIHGRRCASCHAESNLARPEWVDLNDPAASLFIAAPSGEETPSGRRCDPAPYADNDPDRAEILRLVSEAVARAWSDPRRDLRALRPVNN